MASSNGSDGPKSRDELFQELVADELEVLARVARSLTGNPTDAEDLVQDTLLRAYRGIERFDGRYPRAWLLTILRNAQINRVRRKRPTLLTDPDTAPQRPAADSEVHGPESSLMNRTLEASIETSLNGLAESYREAIVLVDIDGLSYNEAASVMGVPTGTVMSRLHRGRKQIRNELKSNPMYVGRSR